MKTEVDITKTMTVAQSLAETAHTDGKSVAYHTFRCCKFSVYINKAIILFWKQPIQQKKKKKDSERLYVSCLAKAPKRNLN